MKCFGYTLIPCEMGSDGYSRWTDYGVYEGETKIDVVKDFLSKHGQVPIKKSHYEIVRRIYDAEKDSEFMYNDYFTSYFLTLPESYVYGHVNKIKINYPVLLHEGEKQVVDYYDRVK